MPARQTIQQPLAPDLEPIATAAADRLHAHADGNPDESDQLQRRVGEAASAAIAAGVSLTAIADAERAGQQRARDELGADVLRRVTRAAHRKRQGEDDYQQEIKRAARLGLSHREIATAAAVAHGTVKTIVARTDAPQRQPLPPEETPPTEGVDNQQT
jgi:DNA-directed RNA polymerase specialized sigma24 family protein